MSAYASKSYVDQQDTSIRSTVQSVKTTADSALTKATTVEQTAEGLEVTLTETTSTANSALSKANTAANDAATAKTNASTALSTANTAKSTADSAKSTATTAQNTANTANTNATTAKNNASTALSTANTAKSTADSAKSTADAAKKQVWHSAMGTSGTAGYIGIATIKITSNYANVPIYFELTSRNKKATSVWVRFASVDGTDPTLGSITADGDANVYVRKTATSTWQLVVQKSESYDYVSVTDFSNGGSYMNGRVSVTWTNVMLASLPSGCTKATVLAGKRNSSDIDNAAKTATNFLRFDSSGLCVGNQTASSLGYNALITSSAYQVRNGSAALSSFGASTVELARNSTSAQVKMCGGRVVVSADAPSGRPRATVRADDAGTNASVVRLEAVNTNTEDCSLSVGDQILDIDGVYTVGVLDTYYKVSALQGALRDGEWHTLLQNGAWWLHKPGVTVVQLANIAVGAYATRVVGTLPKYARPTGALPGRSDAAVGVVVGGAGVVGYAYAYADGRIAVMSFVDAQHDYTGQLAFPSHQQCDGI